MTTLIIRHKRRFYEPPLPHVVFLDGLTAGIIGDKELRLEVPHATYTMRVQMGGNLPFGKSGKKIDLSLSSTGQVEVPRAGTVVYEFCDRERLWNILFDIDLLAWITSWFIEMPQLYKIASDAFFAIWLLRIVLIRKRYYRIYKVPLSNEVQ